MWKKKLVIYLVVLSLCSQSVFATGSINPSIKTDSQFEHKIEIPFLQNISAGSVEDQGKSNTCMIEVLADKVENAAAIAKSEADLIVGNHRPKRTYSHYVDAKFLLSVIDPKEILCPVTPRKVAYWTGY